MITRQEIMDASREFGLGVHIIEADLINKMRISRQ
jgi:hypothetical protein